MPSPDAEIAAGSPALTPSERKLVERLRQEEQSRWRWLPSLITGGLFLWMAWDAPFAFHRFSELPYSEVRDLPYAAIQKLPGWIMGVSFLGYAARSVIFDRKRRLILKLVAGAPAHPLNPAVELTPPAGDTGSVSDAPRLE